MTTGVHDTAIARAIFNIVLFLDRQSIYVGT
jgi:hypothetical protein